MYIVKKDNKYVRIGQSLLIKYKNEMEKPNEGWMSTAIYIWFKDCLHTCLEQCSHTKF